MVSRAAGSDEAWRWSSDAQGTFTLEPAKREPYRYDRDYVVMLSDWTDEAPAEIIRNLKVSPGYYNNSRRTLADMLRELRVRRTVLSVAGIVPAP